MDHFNSNFRRSLIAAAIATALPPAVAEESAVARLTRPESSLSLGLGVLSGETANFGIYNGRRDDRGYGLADFAVNRLDTASGTWLKFSGSNLGLDTREFRLEQSHQGDWGYFIDYSRTPRISPYTVNTGLQGIGSSSQTVSLTGLRDTEIKTVRDKWAFGFDKQLSASFDLQLRFKTEDKDGSRLFGRGTTTPVFQFLAEPIHSTTRQFDASLAYTAERLQLVGGYTGSFFVNHNTALTVSDPLNPASGCTGKSATIGCFSPIALPPGNEAHQLYLTGGYNFTPTTRGNFKLAYSRATQHEAFIADTPTEPNTSGRSNLGGRVDATLVQVGLSARPLPKLALTANLRYEDRDDKTPVAKYFGNAAAGGSALTGNSTLSGENEPRSITATTGKLEAAYQLPLAFRLTGGVEYEKKARNTSDVRAVSFRADTEELTGRAELRRALSETLIGAVSVAHSDRDGPAFYNNLLLGQVDPVNFGSTLTGSASNLIAPIHLADRRRNKLGLSLDWNPIEPLSLQLMLSDAHDSYGRRTYGAIDGEARFVSVDATYRITDAWQTTAYLSRGTTATLQNTAVGGKATDVWAAALRNETDAAGLGLRGSPSPRLQLGADLSLALDRNHYRLANVTGSGVAGSLPDTYAKKTTLGVFGSFALQTNAGLRLDLVHERWRTDEWTWRNWLYSDGTTVFANPRQRANFIGISGYYKWW